MQANNSFHYTIRAFCTTLVMLLLTTGANAQNFQRISNVTADDVYQQQIVVSEASEYRLTLTDFALPDALSSVGVSLVSATDEIASINFETQYDAFSSNSRDYRGRSIFGYTRSPWHSAGSFQGQSSRSLGSGRQQETEIFELEEGVYLLSMYGQFDASFADTRFNPVGLYGVQLIATPIPASVAFLLSGLAVIGWLRRRAIHA